MGMKPRRKRCFCCERLMLPCDLLYETHHPWGQVIICKDADDCCKATGPGEGD